MIQKVVVKFKDGRKAFISYWKGQPAGLAWDPPRPNALPRIDFHGFYDSTFRSDVNREAVIGELYVQDMAMDYSISVVSAKDMPEFSGKGFGKHLHSVARGAPIDLPLPAIEFAGWDKVIEDQGKGNFVVKGPMSYDPETGLVTANVVFDKKL